MALVRGGWLWRQSSILRRWKRNWFALWLDGTLGYYHDETAQDEEDRVVIHFNVRDIKVGQECQDVQPPEGRSRDGLLTVNLREGSRLHLCAETRDDAIAWKTALMEANSTPAPAGATVPPRSRRVCPKVRCTSLSWKPCKVERRIWVSVSSALPASFLAIRMSLQSLLSHSFCVRGLQWLSFPHWTTAHEIWLDLLVTSPLCSMFPLLLLLWFSLHPADSHAVSPFTWPADPHP
ncbi:pleckstrin homology domain-containing family B member 1 isoform X1 [Rattus norvegicus]|uniref:pleckstrin homology domain-containing family B member 1 isoform X1 n=1 Tax=Rattus norvegicus TaxID=10116 RepID=UPI002FD7CA3E